MSEAFESDSVCSEACTELGWTSLQQVPAWFNSTVEFAPNRTIVCFSWGGNNGDEFDPYDNEFVGFSPPPPDFMDWD